MTLRTHAVEILRQGVWASLTGGWFFDPRQSLFCNTVHLYLWILFFLLPLILGLVSRGAAAVAWPLVVCYTATVALVFGALKLLVWSCHRVFDTHEPIPAAASDDSDDDDGERAAPSALDMLEMTELGPPPPDVLAASVAAAAQPAAPCISSSAPGLLSAAEAPLPPQRGAVARRSVRIEERPRAFVGSVVDLAVTADVHHGPIKDTDGSPEGSSLPTSENTLLSSRARMPTDSLELLPIRRQSDEAAGPSSTSVEAVATGSLRRKYSEPTFSPYMISLRMRRARRSSGGRSVRRVRSSVETSRQDGASALVLSQNTLEECKLKGARKSYPSKTSSTDIFLMQSRPLREDLIEDDLSSAASSCQLNGAESGLELGQICAVVERPVEEEAEEEGGVDVVQLADEKCAEVEAVEQEAADKGGAREETPDDLCWLFDEDWSDGEEGRTAPAEEGDRVEPLPASDAGRRHAIAAAARSLRSNSQPLELRAAGLAGTETLGLKEELARLLEEIIESHPEEALEVIENVRMSRLGRSDYRGSSTSADSARRHRQAQANAPGSSRDRHLSGSAWEQRLAVEAAATPTIASAADNSSTYMATSHEDTSEGATHCFQDDDGNWWSYTFGTDGPGTARALGNGRNVMRLLTAQQRAAGARRRKSAAAVEPTQQAEASTSTAVLFGDASPAVPTRAVAHFRARSHSSSSSEPDDSFLAAMPSSILHPLSSSQASREAPLMTLAQRLRAMGGRAGLRSSGDSGGSERRRRLQQAATTSGGSVTTPGDYSTATLGVSGSASIGSGSSLNRIRLLTDVAAGAAADSRRASLRRKYYYQLKLFPKLFPRWTCNLRMDRLRLVALFDRSRSPLSALTDVALAVAAALVACLVLGGRFYNDILLVLFCAVVAASHFSLLKSVQPDSSSPIHGYNAIVKYSRPAYFILFAGALVLSDFLLARLNADDLSAVVETARHLLAESRSLLVIFLLFLPTVFVAGLLPQVNTFVMHWIEQVDMHLLGGTAVFSLTSALYALCRSVVCWLLLSVACRLALGWNGAFVSARNILLAAFFALLTTLSYLLSRASSNPAHLRFALQSCLRSPPTAAQDSLVDPLTARLRKLTRRRLMNDLFVTAVFGAATFGVCCTSVFSTAQPYLTQALVALASVVGVTLHYVYPQLRKHTPWLLVAQPLLRSSEHEQFETTSAARLMCFEVAYCLARNVERFILYPLLILSAMNSALGDLDGDGEWLAAVLLPPVGMRLLRGAFCNAGQLYQPLVLAALLTAVDFSAAAAASPTAFVLCLFALTAAWPKLAELMLKLQFVLAYVAPWQISWGSAFHAFAQPFSVPHSAWTLAQTLASSLLSAPLNPFLGSSIFLTSYMRPVKFWEKDYNTRRVDHSNTRLISQIDRGPVTDDANLNAIFYEHLTRSLQQSLAGDLALGRWPTSVAAGDCFILASFYLNCLVHVIEVGNGFVTFQLRGLEFRGTYCQQREVEAISEDIAEGEGCCCCEPGSLPGFLSFNTAWTLRWLAWEVVTAKFIIEGYSITDNSAVSMLQVHELRRLLVTLYVKCIIFYALMSPKLDEWLSDESVAGAIEAVAAAGYVNVDPTFSALNDDDYDVKQAGVSRRRFCTVFLDWIEHCLARRALRPDVAAAAAAPSAGDAPLVGFCFALSLVGRRALGAAAHHRHSTAAESFLYGLHALFKGDFRITSQHDEWVFADMDLLRCVVAPAVRMAVKLHQDHFTAPDDFDEPAAMFERILSHEQSLFISHEHDPAWRHAVLANTPSLLALRHVFDDGNDEYKVIMLNKRHLNFRVIKLNKECVRAFWAGQQQEQIFLRNRNPERGSIQNARQVLRNMINSSADQPIGYPIYVSPLTTSFVESHAQLRRVVGPSLTPRLFESAVRRAWRWLRANVGATGSSTRAQPTAFAASAATVEEGRAVARTADAPPTTQRRLSNLDGSLREVTAARVKATTLPETAPDDDAMRPRLKRCFSHPLRRTGSGLGLSRVSLDSMKRRRLADSPKLGSVVRFEPGGQVRVTLCADEPSTSSALTAAEAQARAESAVAEKAEERRVRLTDLDEVFRSLNARLGGVGQAPVVWPDEQWRRAGGESGWAGFEPALGVVGSVVHEWTPCNPSMTHRSHIGKRILLVRCDTDKQTLYVPIGEHGVAEL